MAEKNPFRYNTPEYKIHEAKVGLEEALAEVQKLKESISAKVAPPMTVKPCDVMGNMMSNFANYFQTGRHVWSQTFERDNPEHVKKAADNARAKALELWGQCITIHAENKDALAHNIKMRDAIYAFMKVAGISQTYSTWDYKTSRSRNRTETKHNAGYVEDVKRLFTTDDGFAAAERKHKDCLDRIARWEKDMADEAEKKKKEKEAEDKKMRKLATAMQLAEKYGIVDYDNNDDLFSLVNDRARHDFLAAEYADGTEVTHSCCEECSTWTVGEHRCSCGNRRMYLETDGDFFEGFTAYPCAD